MCIWTPSMFSPTPIQVPRFTYHLHPSRISAQSRPKCLHFTSIQVMDVLHLSWSRKLHLSSIQVTSHAHPGLKLCVTPPSRFCLTCIQAPIILSHPHACLNTIQVRNYVSHLHPFHVSPAFKSWYLHTAPSISYLNPIQVSISASGLHPGHVSPPARFHLTPSRSPDVHLTSVQFSIVAYLLHPGYVSSPSRSW